MLRAGAAAPAGISSTLPFTNTAINGAGANQASPAASIMGSVVAPVPPALECLNNAAAGHEAARDINTSKLMIYKEGGPREGDIFLKTHMAATLGETVERFHEDPRQDPALATERRQHDQLHDNVSAPARYAAHDFRARAHTHLAVAVRGRAWYQARAPTQNQPLAPAGGTRRVLQPKTSH